jgi:hypothetical protein
VRFVQKDFGGCCDCQPSYVLFDEEFVALSMMAAGIGSQGHLWLCDLKSNGCMVAVSYYRRSMAASLVGDLLRALAK